MTTKEQTRYEYACEVEDTGQGKMCTWRIRTTDGIWVCDVGGAEDAVEMVDILNSQAPSALRTKR